jgi:hypothetical protein
MEDHKTLTPEIISSWSQEKAAEYLNEARRTGIAWNISKEIMAALNKAKFGDAYIGPEQYKAKMEEEATRYDELRNYDYAYGTKAHACARMLAVEKKPLQQVTEKISSEYSEIKILYEKTFHEPIEDFKFYGTVFNEVIRIIIEQATLTDEQKKQVLTLRRSTNTNITKGNISNKEIPFDKIYEVMGFQKA